MNEWPYVLAIAGFDPSSGAGITSDIKTFEQHEVYGLSVITAITYQNESQFDGVKWISFAEIEKQLNVLALKYTPKAIKIGLIESAAVLFKILYVIKTKWPEAFIIWDPILKASAGFTFHDNLEKDIKEIIKDKINLLTPNLPEYTRLFGDKMPQEVVNWLICSLLLKGGHMKGNEVTDELFSNDNEPFRISSQKIKGDIQKHGTGCVLSSAITAEIAKGSSLQTACSKAHFYVKKIIGSNSSLLGYHYNI